MTGRMRYRATRTTFRRGFRSRGRSIQRRRQCCAVVAASILTASAAVRYSTLRAINMRSVECCRFRPTRSRSAIRSTRASILNSLPPSLAQYAPGIRTPYRVYYGLSLERQIGEKATITIGGRSQYGVGMFRSVDINAPLAESDYTVRPNPDFSQVRQIQSEGTQDGDSLDINYRGRFNRWFNAFAWYTWSHYDNNTSGIYFFPENQQEPNAEWGRADWDTRQRFGIYGEINGEHLLNLGFGVFAHSGTPYTITTGTDAYGDNLYNTRPEGVARNSETGPDYSDLDLRWGYDFKLKPREADKSPTLGVSASAFNVLNEVNGSYIDSVQGSADFNEVIAAYPARRFQLAMRFTF